MRKRTLTFLAAVLLGAVVALIFVNTKPRVPMTVEIVGATNGVRWGKHLILRVTNNTSAALVFGASLQTFSNGVWNTPPETRWVEQHPVPPRSSLQASVWTQRTNEEVRVYLNYHRENPSPRNKLFALLDRCGLRSLYFHRINGLITTPPTNFPAR